MRVNMGGQIGQNGALAGAFYKQHCRPYILKHMFSQILTFKIYMHFTLGFFFQLIYPTIEIIFIV